MPRPKPPLPLYLQCQFVINALIKNACIACDRRCKSYDYVRCESVVSKIQHYLLSNLPGRLLDDLSNNILNNYENNKSREDRLSNLVLDDVDSRVLLSVYLHKNVRRFSVCVRLPSDETFWLKKLFGMHKVIVLDLRMVCTDEILEAIGNNCWLLEEVNIVSNSECYKGYGRRANSATGSKYFISDKGLKHLCKCKRLKKVEMDRVLKTHCAGHVMSHDGIKELIKSLPKLEYLNYTDVGMIVDTLVGEVDQLQLTHIDDFHAHANHIHSFDKLCPNVQTMYLCPLVCTTKRTSTVDIVQALTDSKLKVSALRLTYFPVDRYFKDFLKLKGVFLTSLNISGTELVSSNELVIIGSLCPNLENIRLTKLTSSSSDFENRQLANKTKMFSSLKSLTLNGTGWSPNVILPICLTHSLGLNRIVISNYGYTGVMDDTINEILSVNPLKKLKRINLCSGCFITFEIIETLVYSCSHLTQFSTFKHPALEYLSCARLRAEMIRENMDIEFLFYGY